MIQDSGFRTDAVFGQGWPKLLSEEKTMKCPFELPVKAKESSSDPDLWYVASTGKSRGAYIFGDCHTEYIDYIVHVINSHKKLALYKDYVESRIDICTIPMCFSEWDKCVSNAEKSNEQH